MFNCVVDRNLNYKRVQAAVIQMVDRAKVDLFIIVLLNLRARTWRFGTCSQGHCRYLLQQVLLKQDADERNFIIQKDSENVFVVFSTTKLFMKNLHSKWFNLAEGKLSIFIFLSWMAGRNYSTNHSWFSLQRPSDNYVFYMFELIDTIRTHCPYVAGKFKHVRLHILYSPVHDHVKALDNPKSSLSIAPSGSVNRYRASARTWRVIWVVRDVITVIVVARALFVRSRRTVVMLFVEMFWWLSKECFLRLLWGRTSVSWSISSLPFGFGSKTTTRSSFLKEKRASDRGNQKVRVMLCIFLVHFC